MSQDPEATRMIDEITDNGERVIHLQQHEGFYDHLSIYRFASQFCQGRTVLDAGSGTGYGAAYLADQQAQILQLEAVIGKKDKHIANLEDLIHRIESGRLLRLLRRIRM